MDKIFFTICLTIIGVVFVMGIVDSLGEKPRSVEVIVQEYDYEIHRVYIKGIPYLVNTQGGIVCEGFANK